MLIRAYSYKNMVDIYLLKGYTFCSQYSRCPQGGSASGAGTPANQPRAGRSGRFSAIGNLSSIGSTVLWLKSVGDDCICFASSVSGVAAPARRGGPPTCLGRSLPQRRLIAIAWKCSASTTASSFHSTKLSASSSTRLPNSLALLLGLNEPFTIRLEHSTWSNGLSQPPLHVATYYYPCYDPSQLRQAAAAQAGRRRSGPRLPAGTLSYYVLSH